MFCRIFTALCLVLGAHQLSVAADNDAIVVKLTTAEKLIPTYLTPIENSGSGLSANHLQQLEQVLRFDFGYNGFTRVLNRQSTLDKLAGSFKGYDDLDAWRQQQVYYLVKFRADTRGLSARIVGINQAYIQDSDPIALTGELTTDRRRAHALADGILKGLFGVDGVAQTRLLYTVKTRRGSDSSKWTSEVWECDYDGANARRLTKENSLCVNPSYVPPHRAGGASSGFLYVSYRTGQPKIYVASLDEGQPALLTSLPGNQFMPAMSPQRHGVAFVSDAAGRPDLFFQNVSRNGKVVGKPRQIYSTRFSTQASPTFSPDGKQLAFVSNKDGKPRIYVINLAEAQGRNPPTTLVTKINRENTAPVWSPDGNMIAYCAHNGGDRQIWIADLRTGKERQLTQGPGNKENPTWAPDSLHLVFNSADVNGSELFLVNLNQPDAVKISHGSGEKRFPCWEPRIRSQPGV